MTNPNDIERLVEAVQGDVDYFRKEYNLTYAETIGALELIKHGLMHEND